ncbi:MAG: hypothetical protein QOD57_5568 [Actinomycetota bacterium]|nr:hypothetical protein [Actinomycetota bacterium]
MQADLTEGVTAVQAVPWGQPVSPRDLKLRDRASLITLLIGVGLLWPLPLAGALLMVAAAFGLAVSWEDELSDRAPTGAGRDPYGRITPL